MSTRITTAPPSSINSLTGLRFIAAMMVFVSHFPIPGVSGVGLNVMKSGYAGVTVFFVLSGFIITYNYFDEFSNNSSTTLWRNYFASRFARVYPIYIFFNLYFLTASPTGTNFWQYLFAVQAWSGNLYIAFGQNPPSWSVGVEVFLYLMFPLLVPLVNKLGLTTSRCALLATAIGTFLLMLSLACSFSLTGRADLLFDNPDSAHRWLYRMPVTRLGDFLLGIFGAIYYKKFAGQSTTEINRWITMTYIAAVTIFILMASQSVLFSAFSWDVAYAIPCIVLILGLSIGKSGRLVRFLSTPSLILLGEASYALYLIHSLAGSMLGASNGGLMFQLFHYGMFVLIVIAMSLGVHLIIEKPARAYLRKVLSTKK